MGHLKKHEYIESFGNFKFIKIIMMFLRMNWRVWVHKREIAKLKMGIFGVIPYDLSEHMHVVYK